MAYSRKRLLWEPPSTKHGEWFASTFVLPTVPVIQFQAFTSIVLKASPRRRLGVQATKMSGRRGSPSQEPYGVRLGV